MLQHSDISLTALPGIPMIKPGDDLVAIIAGALEQTELKLQSHDVLVVTSKIISKSEGRFVRLADVQPGEEALRHAIITGKDPRIVELVLRESQEISREGVNTLSNVARWAVYGTVSTTRWASWVAETLSMPTR